MAWNDNPAGLFTNVPVLNNAVNIGDAQNPLNTVYAKNVVATNIAGDTTLGFSQWLQAIGSTAQTLNLVQGDATDNTWINAPTGKVVNVGINGVSVATVSSTAATFSGTVQGTTINLADGTDKNHALSSFASGTAYTLTNTPANTHFGTSDAQLVLDKVGTYLILSKINLEFVGATFAANRTVTLTLHRTNNTPADLTGATTSIGTNIVTTVSGILYSGSVTSVLYTTTNTNDIIQIYSSVSVVPTAGSLQATEANLVAIRLF